MARTAFHTNMVAALIKAGVPHDAADGMATRHLEAHPDLMSTDTPEHAAAMCLFHLPDAGKPGTEDGPASGPIRLRGIGPAGTIALELVPQRNPE